MLFPVISGFLPKSESKWGLSHANTTPRDKRGVTTSKNPTLGYLRGVDRNYILNKEQEYNDYLQLCYVLTPAGRVNCSHNLATTTMANATMAKRIY
eukprot:sb/3479145/